MGLEIGGKESCRCGVREVGDLLRNNNPKPISKPGVPDRGARRCATPHPGIRPPSGDELGELRCFSLLGVFDRLADRLIELSNCVDQLCST